MMTVRSTNEYTHLSVSTELFKYFLNNLIINITRQIIFDFVPIQKRIIRSMNKFKARWIISSLEKCFSHVFMLILNEKTNCNKTVILKKKKSVCLLKSTLRRQSYSKWRIHKAEVTPPQKKLIFIFEFFSLIQLKEYHSCVFVLRQNCEAEIYLSIKF